MEQKHNKVIGDYSNPEITDELCDGTLMYDEGVEGNLCDKCNYYDGWK